MAHGLELRIWRRLSSLQLGQCTLRQVGLTQTYEMRCSTEGSTGVLLSDFRKVERPGA